MNRLKQLKTYPFGLFLVLEWIFLGAALFGELPRYFFDGRLINEPLIFPILSGLCLVGLGLTGLRFPSNNPIYKWLYMFWQLGLLSVSPLFNYFFFIPYLIIVIRSCLIFDKKERWLATIVIVIVFVGSIALHYPSFHEDKQVQKIVQERMIQEQFATFRSIDIVSSLIMCGLCSAFVFMLVNALLREYESRRKLALAHQKLREYAILVEDRATLHERNRIAREIHDSVGHALTAQTIQLNNTIAFWQSEPTKAYQFLTEAKESVAIALQEIRHSVSTLRADPLQGKSLETAIALLVHEFSHHTKVIPQCITSFHNPLSEEVTTTVYRIVQESLTNIAKHSGATEVVLYLQALPESLELMIKDNGKGFDPQQNTTGFGLQGMRERVAALGGKLEITSQSNRGCTIRVKIYYQPSLS